MTGKVLNTYDFKADGKTRLFTVPQRTAENGKSEIFAINRTSDETGELIVLHVNGPVRTTYRGQEDATFAFDVTDVTCDANGRCIVSDGKNKCIHLLSQELTFIRYLLSNMLDYPITIALHQCSLWTGFYKGAVKVYKYTE